MALTLGTRLGVYEVIALIGEGGMGQVLRARDTKLDRVVAIKVLPEAFAHDADRLARFQREAKTLASLNHPNIAAIYGLEEGGGMTALVMELVEGEDLSQRIARGVIPIDEALAVAKQIAEALEAAHEHGIIHRDLKPANIKVRSDGTVKVLDFGLAKAMEPVGVMSVNVSQAPTITTPAMMTGVGMILGTAAYMSPEQARGKKVDQRTDIWAFGCVLYEMLTGRQVFDTADTVSDAVAAILTREPDWGALPASVPAYIRRLLRRCLQKDAARRLHDIADAKIELDDGAEEPIVRFAPKVGTSRRWMRALPWAVTAFALSAAGLMFLHPSGVPSSGFPPVRRLEVSLPPGVELYTSLARSVAVSPDGARLAFVGVRGGNREVYVRRLDEFESTPLRGTEAVTGVFFSPNGESVGLVASNGELRTVSLTDNLVTTLTTGVNYLYGATWSNGRIVFVRGAELWHISPTGGTATQLTSLNSGRDETIHAWPFALPGGDAILFAAGSGSRSRIDALMLSTGERRTVVERGTMPLYASSGHLVFSRDGELLAAPFNATTFEVGAPTVRALDRPPANVAGVPVADLSFSGTLVFAPNVSTGRMVWVSRQGAEQPLNDVPRPYGNPRIAPNGSTVLVEAGDLWIQDVTRATFTRLTSNEGALPRFPVLTPDGRRLMYRTAEGLQLRNAEPGEDGQLVAGTSQFDYPGSLGSDGDTLVFMRSSADTSFDIYALSLRDPGKIRPILKTAAYEGGARLSPDSRWLLYISNESGQNEVYVRAFPSPERRWQVSTEGGTQGVWNPNGREIFYRSGDKMMAVDFQAASDVTLSPPRLLFERPYAYGGGITIANYDVTTDGQRFVLIKDEATTGRVNVVLNWSSELGP